MFSFRSVEATAAMWQTEMMEAAILDVIGRLGAVGIFAPFLTLAMKTTITLSRTASYGRMYTSPFEEGHEHISLWFKIFIQSFF